MAEASVLSTSRLVFFVDIPNGGFQEGRAPASTEAGL